MKYLATALILILLTSVLLPCTMVKAEPAFTPHEDPTAAQSIMDTYSFLSQYADILSLITSKQYANASRLTEQLSHITVPEDLSYIINRFNNITQELINVLADLQNTLDTASTMLNQNRLSEAAQALDHAGILVAKAQILLSDLQDATTTLSQRLGVFAAPAESKIRQAYNAFQALLQRLIELINQYHALLQSQNRQLEEIKALELNPTELTLNLNATNVFVGGVVAASGNLTTNGQKLQNQTVALLLDSAQVATATTDSNGQYNTVLTIPIRYVHTITVQTLYVPNTNETRGKYLASLSPIVSLNVLFYDTKLNVETPNVAYPGLPYTVTGTVSSQSGKPLSERQIKVYFDEKLVNSVNTNSNGIFSIKNNVDTQAKTGIHSLTITVDPQGVYAGTSQQKNITITKIATSVNIIVPTFVLLPAQIQILGTASQASGPLKNAKVTIEFSGSLDVVETMPDGTFNSTINIPLSGVLAGSQTLKVTIQPAEPWYASTQTTENIFVLNSLSLIIVCVISIAIGIIIYKRLANTRSKKDNQKTSNLETNYSSPPENPTKATDSTTQEFKFEGLKGKIIETYLKTLRYIEQKTGNTLKPDMTLREFLTQTKPKLDQAANAFTDLTNLAEKTLYSPHLPEIQDVAKAENYAETIRRIINR